MIRAFIRPSTVAVVAGVLALTSACTMKSQEPPPLAGPSEFDLSIGLAASPDSLRQDGASQSLITITARDANSQPVRNVSLRAQMAVQGTLMDFGALSARSLVTGSDGRATVVYTAPPAPAVPTDPFTIVDILITPTSTNFANANSRVVSIRLYPFDVVVPGLDLVPAFTFNPTSPEENQTVLFDASTSTGSIVSYQWRFGDGGTGSERTTSHQYTTAATYVVRLTVSDAYGRSQETSQSVTVGAGVNPTAAFTFSPTNPLPLQQVFFNASASRPAPGRTIASYTWDFGDGTGGSGPNPSHSYTVAGGYVVTLIVVDDAGRRATISQTVAIGSDDPVADFTFAPQTPAPNADVAFSSTSRAAPGRTIVSATWVFSGGTPATATGSTASSRFSAGPHNVTLTVVDSAGKTDSETKQITAAVSTISAQGGASPKR